METNLCELYNETEQTTLSPSELHFLEYPNRIVVCAAWGTPGSYDPETGDSREFARIVPRTQPRGGIWVTEFEFAGQIEWTKHAPLLKPGQRAQIERFAEQIAKQNELETEQAKALQMYEQQQYAEWLNRKTVKQ